MFNLKLIHRKSLMYKLLSSASEKYISSLITVTATLLLTYFYGIELVGFVGLFSIFIGLGIVLSDGGIGQIILRHNTTSSVLSAFFLVNTLVGCSVFLILLLLSDILSVWANVEYFDLVFKYYCLIIIFNSVSMVPVAVITKSGNYKILNIFNFLAMAISVGLVLITIDKEYYFWASLYFVFFYGLRAIFLFLYVKKLLWTKPNFNGAKQHVRFGAYIFSANALKTVSENTLSFLLPSLVGLQYAGFYGLLSKVRELVTGSLSHAIHRVIYVERTKGNYSNYYARNSVLFLTVLSCLVWVFMAAFIDDFLIYFEVTSLTSPDLTLQIFLFVLISSLSLPAYNIFTQMIQHSDVRSYSLIENAYALSFLFVALSMRETSSSIFTALGFVVIMFLIIAISKFETTYRSRLLSVALFLGFILASYLTIWWMVK